MHLPDLLAHQLGLTPDVAVQVAAVVVGGVRARVAHEHGTAAAKRLELALPELAEWTRTGGLTAQVDAERLALAMGRAETRTIAVIAEVLYGLGAEPAAADLVAPPIRAWLTARLGHAAVQALARVAPFLEGPEATPIPSSRPMTPAYEA